MIAPFDLLKREPDGNIIWIEAVADLHSAHLRLQELATASPGEYLIFDQDHQTTVETISSRAKAATH
ncbi:MAG TPA: hypothetical protein VGI16_12460 [Candidatus Acidoferrum sp.]|jgi:hypothetical protein